MFNKKKQKIRIFSLVLSLVLVLTSFPPFSLVQAATVFTEATDANTLANSLLAPSTGITIGTGTATCVGKMSAASTYSSLNLGSMDGVEYELGNGILVTSGDGTPPTSNTSPTFGLNNGQPGDSQLQTIAELSSSTKDAFSLSFNFTVPADTPSINMDFMFGSEEYPDFLNDVVDGAAVIVDGTNYAYFSGGSPLKVVTEAGLKTNSGLAIEYGGISEPRTMTALLDQSKSVHTIKVVIADTSDEWYDSGLFLSSMRTSTATTGGIGTTTPEPTPTVAPTVAPSVTSVDITQNSVSVEQGYTTQLSANVTVAGGASQNVTWTSDDTNHKVTVDETGKVSVAADATAGNYTITAKSTADTSKLDTATIVVTTDNTAPTLNITKPASTATTYAGTTVSYTVSDKGSGVKSYSYTYNGDFTYNGTEYTNQTVTTTKTVLASAVDTLTKTDESIPSGNYTLTINVFDALDHSTTKSMTVNNTVDFKDVSPTITLGSTQVPYDGTEQKPSVDVKLGSTTLTQGTDYLVSYTNNINAGTATVTISGKGSYSGTASKTFTITPATIVITPASGLSKYYGQVDPVLTYTYTGNVNGETPGFSGGLSRTAGNAIGNYTISLGTLAIEDNGDFKTSNYTVALNETPVNFAINHFTPTEVATTSPDGLNGWHKSNVSFIAPSGYTISSSNALIGNTWASTLVVDSTDSASRSGNYYLKDESGAISDVKSLSYKVDKTPASNIQASYTTNKWYQFLNGITFGLFFNNTVTVTLTASDSTSGVKDFTYTISGETAKITSSTFQVSPEFLGNFSVFAIDNAGNQSESVTFENFAVDSQTPSVPTVSTGSYTEGTWTSGDVTLSVNGSTALSGIKKYQYSTDGQNWTDITSFNGTVTTTAATNSTPANVTEAFITVSSTQNQTYYFRAVSNSNMNGSISDPVIVKIDKVVPVLTITPSSNYSPDWSNQTYTFDLLNTSTNISSHKFQYTTNGGTSWTDIQGTRLTIDSSTDTTYHFRALSGTGVPSVTSNAYVVKVDITAPTGVDLLGASTTWKAEAQILEVVAADTDSSIRGYTYSIDGGLTWSNEIPWSEVNEFTIAESGDYTDKITVRVYNYAGVYTQIEYKTVKIDKEAPVSPSLKQNEKDAVSTKWYEVSTFDVVTEVQEASRSAVTTQYKVSNTKNNGNNKSEWTNVPSDQQLTFLDGINTVQIRTVDEASNISGVVSYTIKVDTTKPLLPTVTIKNSNPSDTLSRTIPTIEITSVGMDDTTSVTNIYYKLWSDKQDEPTTGELLSEENIPVITADGNYNIKVWTVDEAGNVSTNTFTKTILVDTTAPSGELSVEKDMYQAFTTGIGFDLYRKIGQNVKVVASDSNGTITTSGILSIEYLKASSEMSNEALKASDKWTEYKDSFTLYPLDKFIMYARITDKAGNVTYLNTKGYVLENTAPVISGIKNGDTYYASRTVTVTDANLDTVVVKVGEKETVQTVKDGLSTFTLANNGSQYTIIATDKAGNVTTYVVTCNETKTFVDAMIDTNVPNKPTTEDTVTYKNLIGKIDNLLSDETVNLTVKEKATLKEKKDELVEEYRQLEGEKALVVSVANDVSATVDDSTKKVLQDLFTTKDAENVLDGGSVKIELKIDKVSDEEVSKIQKEQTQENKDGLQVAAYLDISILKSIADPNGISSTEKVTNLGKLIRIIIDIPKELRGITDNYYIIRNHDGEITTLKDLDSNPNTITIETDRFSVYAIAYKKGNDTTSDSVVKTGDTSRIEIYFVIGILAILFMTIFIVRRRRKVGENRL